MVDSSGSIICLSSYSNVHSIEEGLKPFCYLLEIDHAKILLDCGSIPVNGQFSFSHLDPLKLYTISLLNPSNIYRIAKDIDAVLCTHASMDNIGGLPYAFSELGLTCPIYMTVAANLMTQVLFSDTYASLMKDERYRESNIAFTPLRINQALTKISGLRYSQPVHFTGKASGLTITAAPAGHSLGGAYWKIRKGNEDIIYVVKFNHKKERHLDGSTLPSCVRPSVLITDSTNALTAPLNKKLKEEEFLNLLISTLRTPNGHVLIPIEATGRILELLLLLESKWNKNHYPYPIYLVGAKAASLVEYARSMLEWMSESLSKSFTANRENPFELKHIKTFPDYDNLIQAEQEQHHALGHSPSSRVILATDASMEYGPSRQLLQDWADNPNSLVLFVEGNGHDHRFIPGTLSYELWSAANQASQGSTHAASARVSKSQLQSKFPFHFTFTKSHPLTQDELIRQRVEQEKQSKTLTSNIAAVDLSANVDYEEDEYDEDLDHSDGKKLNKEEFDNMNFGKEESGKYYNDLSSTGKAKSGSMTSPSGYLSAAQWNWNHLCQYDLYVSSGKRDICSASFPNPPGKKHGAITEYGETLLLDEYPDLQRSSIQASSSFNPEGGMVDLEALQLALSGRSLEHPALSEVSESVLSVSAVSSVTASVENIVLSGPPVKLEPQTFQGDFLASVRLMDMPGRCDGKSLKSILEQIQPRKLVFIHGDSSATQYLSQSLLLSGCLKEQPLILTSVSPRQNISFVSNVFQLQLDDILVGLLHWSIPPGSDYQLASVCGKLFSGLPEGKMPVLGPMQLDSESGGNALLLSLGLSFSSHPLQKEKFALSQFRNSNDQLSYIKSLFGPSLQVGDARLARIRHDLLYNGDFKPHFDQGKLIIGNGVASISKSDLDSLVIDNSFASSITACDSQYNTPGSTANGWTSDALLLREQMRRLFVTI